MTLRSAILLAGSLAVGACCSIPIDLDPEGGGRSEPSDDDAGAGDDSRTTAGHVDLGTAAYPRGNEARRVAHPWWLPNLKPQKYELGYKLDDGARDDIHGHYKDWSRQVGHKKIDRNRFQWRPPRGCMGGLQCVYDTLDEGSSPGVEPIAALFRKRAARKRLDPMEMTSLVITFVQEIKYQIPEDEPFGVMPPALVVQSKWGDCDSKTLLAHMLLRSLGVRSVLISSDAHKHTMLGVALPAPGRSFSYQGSQYAFVELTAPRSPIGHINPELLRPNDWRVVSMRYKPVGSLPEASDAGIGEPDPPKKSKARGGLLEVKGGGRIKLR